MIPTPALSAAYRAIEIGARQAVFASIRSEARHKLQSTLWHQLWTEMSWDRAVIHLNRKRHKSPLAIDIGAHGSYLAARWMRRYGTL